MSREVGDSIDMSVRPPEKAKIAARIENDFTYHTPKGDQQARYEALRATARHMALRILDLTPVSREQSLALTKLEESVMFANAAIARNE